MKKFTGNQQQQRKGDTSKAGLLLRLNKGMGSHRLLAGAKPTLFLVFSSLIFLCSFQNILANDAFEYICISQEDDKIIARDGNSGKTLRESEYPREIIEWAMTMADITILQKGQYEIPGTLEIPRSNVSLIVGKEALLVAAPEANLTVLSEGHGNFPSLIRNKNRDNVKIINLGTLDAGGEMVDGPDVRAKNGWPSCVTFDGRNGGTCGIKGGLIFSTGTVNSHDAFWIVDSKNLKIPLLWRSALGNAPIAMEGCEDSRLGFIAGLMGEKANENETLDFNSFNQRIKVDTVLGWVPGGTKDEILDINNSPDCTIDRVIGFGSREEVQLVSRNKYGPGGRRLTQKPYIDNNSEGTVVKEEEIREKKVKAWEKTFETPGFPDSLPVMKINASLTAVYEDGTKEQVFERSYEFNLGSSID